MFIARVRDEASVRSVYLPRSGDDRDVLARDRKLIFQINPGRAINTTRKSPKALGQI